MVENRLHDPVRMLALSGLLLAAAWVQLRAQDEPQWPVEEGPQPLELVSSFHLPDEQFEQLALELLDENPEARSARAFSYSALERAPQQRSLPDLQLGYRYFLSSPETRVGPQVQGLEVSQAVPWAGKRKFGRERATRLATGASWRARDLERGLIAELKRTYFDAAYLQEALAVNDDEATLLRRFEQIALTRYSTGTGIQQSVIRVQTEITRLADQETALRERLRAAERRIARLVGQAETPLALHRITLQLPSLQYDKSALEQEAVAQNPGMQAVRQQIEADEAWVRQKRRGSYPDFNFGLGWAQVDRRQDTAGTVNPPEDNGKDIWALSARISIPVYRGRVRGGVAEAREHLSASQYALEDRQDRLRYGVQESVLRLESFDERARLYREVLIPQAGESLASAEAAYTTNRQSFLDLLDSERVLFQVRLTYHRLLADYWIALADLERAIARPFPDGTAGSNGEGESTP